MYVINAAKVIVIVILKKMMIHQAKINNKLLTHSDSLKWIKSALDFFATRLR